MDRKFLISLAFACIVVAAAPPWGRDVRPAFVAHNHQG
jgi:hypothetical protein